MKKRISSAIVAMAILFSFLASCGTSDNHAGFGTSDTSSVITKHSDYYNQFRKNLNLDAISYKTDILGGKFSNYLIADESIPQNRIQFTVVPTSITPIVNLKKAGIDVKQLFQDYYGIYAEKENTSHDAVEGERRAVKYEDCIDEPNRRVKDGFVMVLVEYEVHNIDCEFRFFEDSNIENSESYYNMWHLYNMVDFSNGVYMSMPIYFDEYGRDLRDIPEAIRIEKGETAKIHVGYILKSGGNTPYAKVGMDFYGHFYGGMGVDDLVHSFDLSKEAAAVLSAG